MTRPLKGNGWLREQRENLALSSKTFERGSPMSEITRVGVDLEKSVLQVNAVDTGGKLVTNRQLSRDKFVSWCGQQPAGCLVAMEACGGSRHWARKLMPLGLNVKSSHATWGHPIVCRAKVARMAQMMPQPFAKQLPGQPSEVPAALRPGLQPHRAGVCQAQGDAVKTPGPNGGRPLARHWRIAGPVRQR